MKAITSWDDSEDHPGEYAVSYMTTGLVYGQEYKLIVSAIGPWFQPDRFAIDGSLEVVPPGRPFTPDSPIVLEPFEVVRSGTPFTG
jgi:hypothetical protein